MIQIIKVCLNQTSSALSSYGFWATGASNTENFIAHTPNYYCRAMAPSLTAYWKNDVDHDPLQLTKVNTNIFKDNDGKGLSYYDVLLQVLGTFHLRVMLTSLLNDEATSGEFDDGNCVWYIQSPLIWHDGEEDYEKERRCFFHDSDVNNNTALSVAGDFVSDDGDPSSRLSGGEEIWIEPILSYQSVYNHTIFNNQILGPFNFNSALPEDGNAPTTATTVNYFTLNPNSYVSNSGLLGIDLDDNGENPVGVCTWNRHRSQVRIQLIGNVSIALVDWFYVTDPTLYTGAWLSGEDVYNMNPIESSLASGFYSGLSPTSVVMPRMGLKVVTTIPGAYAGQTINQSFWWYDMRFNHFLGSLPWQWNTNLFGDNGIGSNMSTYPDNYAAFDAGGIVSGFVMTAADGTKFNPYDYSTVPTDSDGLWYWGEDLFEWSTGNNAYGGSSPFYGWVYGIDDGQSNQENSLQNNHWGWFSPNYFEVNQMSVPNYNPTNNTWTGNWWEQVLGTATGNTTVFMTSPFNITSAFVPFCRASEDDSYPDWCRIDRINLFWGLSRDWVKGQICAQKNWTNNRSIAEGGRGLAWYYMYNDVRVYLAGEGLGDGYYDTTNGWWQNDQGNPSEEYMQEPEFLIGDNPPVDPFSSEPSNDSQYLGRFLIYQSSTADAVSVNSVNPYTEKWRPDYKGTSSSQDKDLMRTRCQFALRHNYQVKRKLDLSFRDSDSNRGIEGKLFSQLYHFTSGTWKNNQSGYKVAYIVTGGKFTAGTGMIRLTMEDCVSCGSTSIGEDLTYNSNG